MLDQVNLDEDPTFSDLGSRYLASLGLGQQRDRVNLQQGSSFAQGKRVHGLYLRLMQPPETWLEQGQAQTTFRTPSPSPMAASRGHPYKSLLIRELD